MTTGKTHLVVPSSAKAHQIHSVKSDAWRLWVKIHISQFSSVQLLSHVWLFATPWIAACQASLSITNSWSSLKLMSIESVMPSSHLILCHPLLHLPPIPHIDCAIYHSHIPWLEGETLSFLRTSFQMNQFCISGGQSIGVSASASVLPMEYSALISFRMDWLDLLARDSQESSPAPQFKSINSLALTFLYSPTLTSIHDYWKNHGFD